ncbi:MAG TPA: asparagine synthase (glutamine-hydrolyzing) [Geminicoccaceae bacterium]|nr:asparagine synthase (glutamine-hydrolyzing) [Geminicoccaceae bacterium]
MCGIVGLFDPDRRFAPHALRDVVGRMRDSLRHRGPDSAGAWFDADAGLALGHRRLAIIDRSASGQQPMVSPSGRYCIVFNGEIYNFPRLRRELVGLGAELRGRSDTEVLLAAIDQWGLRPTLGRLVGMFAFALWDRQTGTLTLGRDHLGQKPLYFARIGSTFAFASELKAFAAHPDFDPDVDRGALALFLRHQYVPSPHTIWEGVHKLPAGCFLALDLSRGRLPDSDLRDRIERHWCARTIAEAGRETDATFADGAALDRLDQLLSRAVGDCMVADVPLGAFLSGGIDSSLVVAMMQKHAARPVRTFTIGFREASFDEAADARRVARHLGTEHTELYLPPSEARAIIPQLPEMFDEPFSDPSQIPTFHVARLAKAHVTVALSGDGADEMFGGYGRYLVAERLRRQAGRMPRALRHTAAALAHALPPAAWDLVLRLAHLQAPPGLRGHWSGDRVHKLAALLRIDDPDQLYRAVISAFQDPCAMVIGADEPLTAFTDPDSTPQLAEYTERMMYYDTVTYLPDDILVKLDRASMAVSLEARVPLLDHRLVEFALQLPLEAKLQAGRGKWLLRQLFTRYLPAELAERPKQGFAIPLADWLRGPLRDWAEALLDDRRLVDEGFLNARTVRRKWQEHLSGSRNWSNQVWNLLVFQAWQERWLGTGRPLPVEARAGDPAFEEWSSRAEACGP